MGWSDFEVHEEHVDVLFFVGELVCFFEQFFQLLAFLVVFFPQGLHLTAHFLVHFEHLVLFLLVVQDTFEFRVFFVHPFDFNRKGFDGELFFLEEGSFVDGVVEGF